MIELENLVSNQKSEIQILQQNLKNVEERNLKSDLTMKTYIQEIVTDITVSITEKVMAAIVPLISKIQDDAISKYKAIDDIRLQVASISNLFHHSKNLEHTVDVSSSNQPNQKFSRKKPPA